MYLIIRLSMWIRWGLSPQNWNGCPEGFEDFFQALVDYSQKLEANREYIYDARNWENELQNNIQPLINLVPSGIPSEQRTVIVDAIIISEAQKLQRKYLTIYTASNNPISKYVTERRLHQGLVSLYEQYPTAKKNTNPLVKAFVEGFVTGLNAGTWYSATSPVNKGTSSAIKGGSKVVGKSSEVTNLLGNMPELTGSNRDKLLSAAQNSDLRKIVDELYRPGATVGDGGTATKLVQEFYEGSSAHLIKAEQRLEQLNKLARSGKLGLNDLDILEALRNDLSNAINLFK